MSRVYRKTHIPIFGDIYIIATEIGISNLLMSEAEFMNVLEKQDIKSEDGKSMAAQAEQQLIEYFLGQRTVFQLPLDLEGTAFQQSVWNALTVIPYGKTQSYADIAEAVKNPKAVRAVGQANRVNPVPIIIPCHRVIGKSGKLTGYAGTQVGLKEQLLQLEGLNVKDGIVAIRQDG